MDLHEVFEETNYRAAILESLDVILEAMEEFAEDEWFQAQCCIFLWRVAKSSEGMVAVGKAGGAKSIVQALFAHPNDTVVQLEGCKALELLSWDAKITRDIDAAGGMIALLDASQRFIDHDEIRQSARCARNRVMLVENAMEDWRYGDPTPWTEYGAEFDWPDPMKYSYGTRFCWY
jgi:hypothetical protein